MQEEKWHIRKKKGYLKIQVAVDIKTNKEILAFLEVTDEKSHDGRKVMPRLIEHILKRKDNKDVKIESALGDGSYDSYENFKYLQKKRNSHNYRKSHHLRRILF